ncbi:alpha/beta fold hydrolase [Dyadobacter psychrotolerans]|uniref:Alpha/beta hydrolase n=1 Tax=Dyadobacter psychrotolerans TaxID=2541721 RepID=A0A4R5DVJ4_9BACT|nr:alpha/beta hydrolase [Dyadobacter psychrotolerans]TDE16161.1 alpha/beta hydrolase [Dyadobacter psychrotolerans]
MNQLQDKLKFLCCLLSLVCINAIGQDLKQLRHFMQQNPSSETSIPYGNNPKAGHYLKADNARIYYEVYGKGKPFVILHGGIFGSTLEMGRFIDSLSKNYKVIAISTRGHGKSEIGKSDPSYEQKAKDVNAIIQAETSDSATVLGFSDGAYTGYYLSAAFPAKVKKLIAIGAGTWKKGWRNFTVNKEMALSLDSLYWKQQMALVPEPERVDEWFASISKTYNSTEVKEDLFKKIQCPVLVLSGELDQNAPLQSVIDAYRLIPNARLGIIPNAPHPVFLVNFDAVWASMTPFLRL